MPVAPGLFLPCRSAMTAAEIASCKRLAASPMLRLPLVRAASWAKCPRSMYEGGTSLPKMLVKDWA